MQNETLAQQYKRIGLEVPSQPKLNPAFKHVEIAFWSINNERTHNGYSLQSINSAQLEAWQRVNHYFLTNDEITVIQNLADAHDRVIQDITEKDNSDG